MNTNFLRIPLYKLYYIDDVSEFSGFTIQSLESLKCEYSESELRAIVESVNWATHNPDYDFSSLLPNLQHSNEDIYKYLCTLRDSLSSL